MSDPSQGDSRRPVPAANMGNLLSNVPQLVYLLNFGGFVVAVLPVIGLVLAYVNRDRATPFERSHYDFQISTFWRGIVILLIGVVSAFFLIGWLVIAFWVIWTIIRNVKGITALSRNEPMRADIGWGFG